MQGDAGIHCKRLKELAHQFGIECADFGGGKLGAEHQKRPPGNINGDAGECFIHRQMHIGIAGDALHVAKRLPESLPQRYADIFHCVVIINVQIALGRNDNVHQRVTGNLVEHVIEKTNAGGHFGFTGAIENKTHRNVGFFGGAGNSCSAHEAAFFYIWPLLASLGAKNYPCLF